MFEDNVGIPPVSNVQPQKKSNNKLLVVLIVILGLVIIGGGAWAYTAFFQNNPQKTLALASEKLNTAQSFHYESSSQFDLGANTQDQANLMIPGLDTIKLSLSGDLDSRDTNNPKTYTQVQLDLGDSLGKASLELKSLDNRQYIKVNSLPSLFSLFGGPIMNTWIDISLQDLQNTDNSMLDINVDSDFKLSKLQDFFNDTDLLSLITITDTLGVEDVNGAKAYHYTFTIDQQSIKQLKINFANAMNVGGLGQDDIAKIQNDPIDVNISGDLWIEKEQANFIKLTATANYNNTSSPVELTLSNFNEELNIDTPSDTKNIEDLFNEIMADNNSAIDIADLEMNFNEDLQDLLDTNGLLDCGRPMDESEQGQAAIDCFFNNLIECRPAQITVGSEIGIDTDTLLTVRPESNQCITSMAWEDKIIICQDLKGIEEAKSFATGSLPEERFMFVYNLPIDIMDSVENPEANCSMNQATAGDIPKIEEVEIIEDADGDGLDIKTEAFYGTDPDNPDTDGDGYTDGEEVNNGYNPNGPGKL